MSAGKFVNVYRRGTDVLVKTPLLQQARSVNRDVIYSTITSRFGKTQKMVKFHAVCIRYINFGELFMVNKLHCKHSNTHTHTHTLGLWKIYEIFRIYT